MASRPPARPAPDAVAALSASWFGAGLSPEAIDRLARLADFRDLDAGEAVLEEGEVTEMFGILLAGRIALRMLVPERGMVTILTVEPGDIVGWSAIVPPHRATSSSIAIEPCRLLEWPGQPLRALLRADHALAASLYPRVLQAVARRLTATRLQLLDLFARDELGRPEVRPW